MTKAPKRRIECVDHYQVDKTISVRGSTEKDVLRDPKTGYCYIAKLGRRDNDLEVMSEYAIYLIGRSLGVNVAEARLGRYKGRLRFMSRYFLDTSQSAELVHSGSESEQARELGKSPRDFLAKGCCQGGIAIDFSTG